MSEPRYLLGPGGLRVDVVELDDADLAWAHQWVRRARPGREVFLVTRGGALLAYCADVEALIGVGVDLTGLRGPLAEEDIA